jgi:predicted phage terminase large subunit-like protein
MAELTKTQLAYCLPGCFASYCSNGRWKYAPHLKLIEDKLLDVVSGKTKRLMISMPPRAGKSMLISHYFPAWYLGRFPDNRIILAAYEATFAASWGRKARDAISEYGKNVFGVEVADTPSSADDWGIKGHIGGMNTAGAGGSLTGRGADIMIADDLVKNSQEALSVTTQDSIFNWFQSTFYTRLTPDGSVIIVMTRWSTDDIIGKLLGAMKKDEGESWEVLNLPALALTDDDPLGRKIGEGLWPEGGFDAAKYGQIKKTVGSFWWNCTPAETPILMSDWSNKPISEIKEGDEIIGFTKGTPQCRGKLVKSKVKHVFKKVDEVVSLKMESGRKIRCTKDHNWYVRGGDRTHKRYNVPKVGRRINYICPPLVDITDEEKDKWSWLAGFFDGEGSMGKRLTVIGLYQSMRNPDVVEYVDNILKELNLKHGRFYTVRSNLPTKGTQKGLINNDMVSWNLHNATDVARKLIHYGNTAKKDRLIELLYKNSANFVKDRDKILDITSDGVEEVYALETETGNYVAWGYGSSNSMYMGKPNSLEGDLIKMKWFNTYDTPPAEPEMIIVSVDTAQKEGEINDYTVIMTWALYQNSYYILNVQRDKMDHPTLLSRMISIAKYGISVNGKLTRPHAILIEDKGSGTSIIQHLELETSANVIALSTKNQSKLLRMQNESPAIEAGRVFIPKEADWMTEFTDEIRAWPKCLHDDQVDCVSAALQYFRERETQFIDMF